MTVPCKGILILPNDGRTILVMGRKIAVLVHYCDMLGSTMHMAHGPSEVHALYGHQGN